MTDKKIPIVDLSLFTSGDENHKQNFVSDLGQAFETIGFVSLKGHQISDSLLKKLYAEVQHFFHLPEAIKSSYEIEELGGQRGYTSFGKEHAKGRSEGDLKEFWHFGQEVLDKDPIEREYPANIKCVELPEFHSTGMLAYRELERVGKLVLRAIAIHLNLEENYFDKWVHNGNSILRPIHYPPIVSEPKNALRAAEHEDINLITLLVGASAEGLQVLSKSGEWITAETNVDYLVINVGDMLQRLTNNKLKSTTHRVVNPTKDKWAQPRFSIPFFLHPRSDMPLNCLPSCMEDGVKHYEDCTAGKYLYERLVEIGLIKK